MSLSVVHFGTGNTGRHGLAQIIQDPALELIGVGVTSPEKVGADAGTLCGQPSTGIVATDDLEALLALEADCLAYFGEGIARPLEAVADMALLRGTGARGLRAILEEVLLDVMYDLPGRHDIGKCVIDRAVVLDRVNPTLVPLSDPPAKAPRSRRAAS